MCVCVSVCARVRVSHREQDHGDGESDGHQHGQTHAQEEHVQGVHLAVGVQELRLHAHCTRQGREQQGSELLIRSNASGRNGNAYSLT